MDDGLGFSIGSIFGGFLFQSYGGKISFQIFAAMALITCIAHIILRPAATHEIRTLPIKTKNLDRINEEDIVKVTKETEEETFEIDTK